uniref:Uncharacterized protein n=1 Tax=Arundo donax TaxID=35708 RepID=A0A0A9G0J0_ARUDO
MVFFTELLIKYLMVTFHWSIVDASTMTLSSPLWTQSETPHLTQRTTVYLLSCIS